MLGGILALGRQAGVKALSEVVANRQSRDSNHFMYFKQKH
jgi:hypothetical protein